MRIRFSRVVVCCAVAILAACAGDGPAPQQNSSNFDVLQREILNRSCTSGPCHNPQSVAGGLILTEGFSFENLVDATPQNAVAQDQGLLRVTPFDQAASFLLRKLEDPGPGEGSRMPLGDEPLRESDIQLIRNWISNGANGPQVASPGTTESPTPTWTVLPDTPTPTPSTEPTAGPTTPVSQSPTPTSPAPTNTPAVSFRQIQDEILTPSCAALFCHNGEFPSAGLNLEDGQAFDALVGISPTNTRAATDRLLRVAAGNPDNSYLIVKIEGPASIELGSRMPLARDPLTAEQIALVRSWITTLSATR